MTRSRRCNGHRADPPGILPLRVRHFFNCRLLRVPMWNVRLGGWSRIFAFGYSNCRRCRTPWRFVQERTVWYTPSSGQFALCVKCWDECDVLQRTIAHQLVSEDNGFSEETFEDIEQAIVRDSMEESTHA